jgi:hypothetical protein
MAAFRPRGAAIGSGLWVQSILEVRLGPLVNSFVAAHAVPMTGSVRLLGVTFGRYTRNSSGGSWSVAPTETGRNAWEAWHFGYGAN